MSESGVEITSVIVGKYEEKIYRVEYFIKTDPSWQTVAFEIESQHDDKITNNKFKSDGSGNWFEKDKNEKLFKGCIDIDIPLTPFTNTLPINRLKLVPGEEKEIRVLYIDILAQQIIPVRQKYKRLSDTKYHYENIPNDFEATIIVDDLGLVVDYPSLFVRTAAIKSNYE